MWMKNFQYSTLCNNHYIQNFRKLEAAAAGIVIEIENSSALVGFTLLVELTLKSIAIIRPLLTTKCVCKWRIMLYDQRMLVMVACHT